MSWWAIWTEPICEECLGGPYGPGPFVRLNRKETAKSIDNGGGGGGEGGIRNIEIAIRNIGLNSKEIAKSRHNGGGGGGEEGDHL